MPRHTKIIATLGPASESEKTIKELIKAGMNIVRLNFSHGTYEQFTKLNERARKIAKACGKEISVMQDLQGPKIRIGKDQIEQILEKGDKVKFSVEKTAGCVHIPYPVLLKAVKKGQYLLIEDGLLRTEILGVKNGIIEAKALTKGVIKASKGVNIPDSKLPPDMTLSAKDKKDLLFGVQNLKVDAVAVSFVENAEDINRVKKAIRKITERPVMVFAKIERKEALKNLNEIVEAADGIMVARGDLGIETEAASVPITQKRIVNLSRREGKPVIIATQMLQSMVEDPMPTRAEVSDVASAVFDHADAIMLSNESAVGLYPVKAVETLADIAQTIENSLFQEQELFPSPDFSSNLDGQMEDESMALGACRIAEEINAKAIVVISENGFTARSVLKHRPKTPVILATQNSKLLSMMNFLWGVHGAVIIKESESSENIRSALMKSGALKKGGEIVLIKLSKNRRSLVILPL